MKKLECVSDRVLIEVDSIDKNETFTPGGMIVQAHLDKDRKQLRCSVGIVRYIGPTAFDNTGFLEDEVKVGDRVHFVEYGGRAIRDPADDKNNLLRVIQIGDIYCKEVEDE